jgi:hypothetical protein
MVLVVEVVIAVIPHHVRIQNLSFVTSCLCVR